MTDNISVLPFIFEAHEEKSSRGYPAELASAMCLTEFQRKKTGFLRDAEKVSFLSKLYYPIWVAPIEESSVIIDGLASSIHSFALTEPTKTGLFVEDLKKNTVSPKEFAAALSRQAKNADKLTTAVDVEFKAVIADKELLKFLHTYIDSGVTFSGDKIVFLPSEIDDSAAATTRETVVKFRKRICADIKGVQYALEVLEEETEFHERMLLNEIEVLKEKSEAEVANLQPEVEKNVDKLKSKLDKDIALTRKDTEKKMAALDKKREKYLQKLQGLEKRKEGLQKKHSRAYMVEKYSREIDSAKKEVRQLTSMIETAKKEGDKNVKKLEEEFRVAAALEEDKINKLKNAYEAKIVEKQKLIANMASEKAVVTKSFTGLIDEMNRTAQVFKEQTTANWKLNELTLTCVPIYMAGYVKGGEERYSLFSPVTIAEDASVLQELRKRLTLTSEPRLKSLMRPASKELHELLSSAVVKKMQSDETFKRKIIDLCHTNNVLGRADFEKVLKEGLTEAEQERWITAEEAAAIYRGVKGEEV